MKKVINRERRRKDEEYVKCHSCSMWAMSTMGESRGFLLLATGSDGATGAGSGGGAAGAGSGGGAAIEIGRH